MGAPGGLAFFGGAAGAATTIHAACFTPPDSRYRTLTRSPLCDGSSVALIVRDPWRTTAPLSTANVCLPLDVLTTICAAPAETDSRVPTTAFSGGCCSMGDAIGRGGATAGVAAAVAGRVVRIATINETPMSAAMKIRIGRTRSPNAAGASRRTTPANIAAGGVDRRTQPIAASRRAPFLNTIAVPVRPALDRMNQSANSQ